MNNQILDVILDFGHLKTNEEKIYAMAVEIHLLHQALDKMKLEGLQNTLTAVIAHRKDIQAHCDKLSAIIGD